MKGKKKVFLKYEEKMMRNLGGRKDTWDEAYYKDNMPYKPYS